MPNWSRSNRFARNRAAFAAKFKPRPPLSKPAVKEVKQIVKKLAPTNRCHNGPLAANQTVGQSIAPVANFWQNVRTLSDLSQGNAEFNRTGDQVYITRIRLKAYIQTNASNDALRIAILRQKSTGVTPAAINPNLLYQVVTPGQLGLISEIQDDCNVSTLYDKTYTLGIAAGLQECRVISIDLKNKAGWPLVYYDSTVNGTTATTVIGDIALCVTSVSGNVIMDYVYSIDFREK